MERRGPRHLITDTAFVIFALASGAALTRMTVARPSVLDIGLAVAVWLGFGLMALDRLWLRSGRAGRDAADARDGGRPRSGPP
jgi:hypothetical protein